MNRTTITFCSGAGPLEIRTLVPETSREQERGLQPFRISEHEGMMFLSAKWPKEEVISMWQASVPYSLAMVWIGQDNTVRFIEFVEPGDRRTYSHKGVAVVELNAEVPIKYGIARGSIVKDGGNAC